MKPITSSTTGKKNAKQRLSLPTVKSEQSLKVVLESASDLYNIIDTSVSRECAKHLLKEDFVALANMEISPDDYNDPQTFFDDYTAISYLKKYEKLPTGVDTTEIALGKFLEAEVQCKETNKKFPFNCGAQSNKSDRRASTLISVMQREISNCLGDLPSLLSMDFKFGPGATSSAGGTAVTVADKLQAVPECTLSAVPHVNRLLGGDKVLRHAIFGLGITDDTCSPLGKLHIVNHNRLAFVPKNAKTDRAICIEPHLNTLLQKGIGAVIRHRLIRFGIFLSKQADKNAELARLGSIDGSYATIDLSSASDTISSNLVLELLPLEWVEFLDDVRSPYTKLVDGTIIESEKFSSMGNGFTFELETLIFTAAVRATTKMMGLDYDYSVYGDDIIVRTEVAEQLIANLEFLGFKINQEKSFVSGPFRESCGKDYFNGHLVRPLFIKKEIKNVYDYYKMANGIRTLAMRHSLYGFADARFQTLWSSLKNRIPKKYRFYGPRSLGDNVIGVPRSEVPNKMVLRENSRCWVDTIRQIPQTRRLSRFGDSVIIASALYKATEHLSIRGRHIGYVKARTPIPGWSWSDGTWI